MFKWQMMSNAGSDGLFYQIWRQTRELERGEPMYSGVRDIRGHYDTREEAQQAADKLNAE